MTFQKLLISSKYQVRKPKTKHCDVQCFFMLGAMNWTFQHITISVNQRKTVKSGNKSVEVNREHIHNRE